MTDTGTAVLIVDDEPPLLRLMQAYLERLGYAVTGCGDVNAAFQAFDEAPERYRILIADLSLPGMQGDQMAMKMRAASPELRVLLCSGYPFDVASLPQEHRSHFAVLQKPFLPNMLAKSVEDLLKASL